jgi:hypothetical protein
MNFLVVAPLLPRVATRTFFPIVRKLGWLRRTSDDAEDVGVKDFEFLHFADWTKQEANFRFSTVSILGSAGL